MSLESQFGGLPWMQAVFYGVGASVIGIIAMSAQKLARKTLGKDKLLWLIYSAAVAVTVVTESEKILLFLVAGLLAWLVKAPPRMLARRTAGVMAEAPFLPMVAMPES